MTGMRRNEVLGLQWPDIDFDKRRLAINRGLIAFDEAQSLTWAFVLRWWRGGM